MFDRIQTPEHRENVRKASFLRESTIRRKVSVKGVVYDNLTRAAVAVGLHQRTIDRYAKSDKEIHKDYFFIS